MTNAGSRARVGRELGQGGVLSMRVGGDSSRAGARAGKSFIHARGRGGEGYPHPPRAGPSQYYYWDPSQRWERPMPAGWRGGRG
jgi:hypothetical protein